jgi:2-polyprenyl-3-methyl-5-hydroxy-6-metoxy-1,4-benzoquinol methylase
VNEAARYVQSLGLSWFGPLPSSPYKMAKIVDLAGHSVLDVGCADGRYVALCQRIGKRAHGIDLDWARLKQAGSDFGRFFSQASADALPFADKSFDTVAMWDVMEHTSDDRQTMREALRVARKNILLSVPKETDSVMFTPSAGITYLHYIDATHVRYYSVKSISALMTAVGVKEYHIEHWCRIYPVSVYKKLGISRLVTASLDRILWLLGREKTAFFRNLFVQIVLEDES